MDRLEQIQSTDYMKVAEQIYHHMNPDSKMNTPNSAYLIMYKWYKEWCMVDTNESLFDWCIENKR